MPLNTKWSSAQTFNLEWLNGHRGFESPRRYFQVRCGAIRQSVVGWVTIGSGRASSPMSGFVELR
jgi:hypothetical protein